MFVTPSEHRSDSMTSHLPILRFLRKGGLIMRFIAKASLCAAILGLMSLGVSSADAKGCLKGAVVGGVAGHVAGHGVLGAAGGCAVGHHMANKHEQEREQQTRDYPADGYRPQPYEPGYH
jgi:hypothetical protein